LIADKNSVSGLSGQNIFVSAPGSRERELPESLKLPTKLLQPVEPNIFPLSPKFIVGGFSDPVSVFPSNDFTFHSFPDISVNKSALLQPEITVMTRNIKIIDFSIFPSQICLIIYQLPKNMRIFFEHQSFFKRTETKLTRIIFDNKMNNNFILYRKKYHGSF